MAIQVALNPSDLTPPPGAFQQLVEQVLMASGARWVDTAEDGDLALADGGEIGLFLDDEENVAVFVLAGPTEAAFDLVHSLAEQAASFVCLGARSASLPTTGAVIPDFAAEVSNAERVPDRRAFGDWMRVAIAAANPTPARDHQPPQRSLFQRLSDSLFGKEI